MDRRAWKWWTQSHSAGLKWLLIHETRIFHPAFRCCSCESGLISHCVWHQWSYGAFTTCWNADYCARNKTDYHLAPLSLSQSFQQSQKYQMFPQPGSYLWRKYGYICIRGQKHEKKHPAPYSILDGDHVEGTGRWVSALLCAQCWFRGRKTHLICKCRQECVLSYWALKL